MGFFQNLKEDLSTAMNELIADENAVKDEETKPLLPGEGPLFGDTEGEAKNSDADKKEDAEPELEEGEDFMEKILAQTEKELQKTEEKEADAPLDLEDALDKTIAEIVGADEELTETTDNEADDEPGEDSDTDELAEKILAASDIDEDELPETEEEEESQEEDSDEDDSEESEVENDDADIYEEKENRVMEETMIQTGEISEETATITEGMKITGNVDSNGHMDVLGTIVGNINIAGKLNVSGSVTGDSKANEIFADGAEITGEVCAVGSIKVGQSSVIIGNITATSAVIAGAVKGDIDVKGPVILDSSAIIMGNIKSMSVQINNGAVIEGMCSQCYAKVSPSSFFEEFKKTANNISGK